jgi:hypothetical protein
MRDVLWLFDAILYVVGGVITLSIVVTTLLS